MEFIEIESGWISFKSLWGPNGTKTAILIYNNHIDALDARSGPAKMARLGLNAFRIKNRGPFTI